MKADNLAFRVITLKRIYTGTSALNRHTVAYTKDKIRSSKIFVESSHNLMAPVCISNLFTHTAWVIRPDNHSAGIQREQISLQQHHSSF